MTDRTSLKIPKQNGNVGLLDYELESVLLQIRNAYLSTVVGTKIFESGMQNEYIHSHFTQLYRINNDSEIEVGTVNTIYCVNKKTHEVVIVHNIAEGSNKGYYLINFNGRLLDNCIDEIDEKKMFFTLKGETQDKKPVLKNSERLS